MVIILGTQIWKKGLELQNILGLEGTSENCVQTGPRAGYTSKGA